MSAEPSSPVAAFVMTYPWPFIAAAVIVVAFCVAYLIHSLRG